MRALHGSVQVSVGADDQWRLTTELKSHRDDILRGLLHDDLADLCAACECNLRTKLLWINGGFEKAEGLPKSSVKTQSPVASQCAELRPCMRACMQVAALTTEAPTFPTRDCISRLFCTPT